MVGVFIYIVFGVGLVVLGVRLGVGVVCDGWVEIEIMLFVREKLEL